MSNLKHTIRSILSRTFSRMTTYLAIFNFIMLCFWLYDNSAIGDMLKENNMRPGDMILIALFAIVAISAIEMVILGMNQEEQ